MSTLRIRLHFLTNLDEEINADFMKVVAIYLAPTIC